jgi:WD repeat-containing protein 23
MDGITCVTSKGDGRYFISNGKDQTMKLWDIRRMKSQDDVESQTHDRSRLRSNWDYRYQNYRYQHRVHPNDMSIMSYVGHRVLQTLIRCYFSPPMSTGQRYVYSGSQDGCVYVYDLLTGALVNKLVGHGGVVRDVSWHPYLPMLLSSSWDCTVNHWTYRRSSHHEKHISHEDVMEDDGDEAWQDVDDDGDEDYVPISEQESD